MSWGTLHWRVLTNFFFHWHFSSDAPQMSCLRLFWVVCNLWKSKSCYFVECNLIKHAVMASGCPPFYLYLWEMFLLPYLIWIFYLLNILHVLCPVSDQELHFMSFYCPQLFNHWTELVLVPLTHEDRYVPFLVGALISCSVVKPDPHPWSWKDSKKANSHTQCNEIKEEKKSWGSRFSWVPMFVLLQK